MHWLLTPPPSSCMGSHVFLSTTPPFVIFLGAPGFDRYKSIPLDPPRIKVLASELDANASRPLGILTDWRNRKENVVLDGLNKFLECTKSGVFNKDFWIVPKLNYYSASGRSSLCCQSPLRSRPSNLSLNDVNIQTCKWKYINKKKSNLMVVVE